MKKIMTLLALSCAFIMTGCADSGQTSSDKINIIFETDMGNDVDDAMAMDMLYKYQDQGVINLLAVMINKCAPAPAEYMDIMNTWYGYPDIPVGIVRDGSNDKRGLYAQHVVDMKNPDGTPMFKRSHGDYDKLPDAHILYRKILSEMPDKSVVIPTVGFSTNLARLLDTPADEYSPLTGRELVEKKVKLLVAMAGHASMKEYCEYNVIYDIPAAKKVLETWPTPVVISPFEVGLAIQYPGVSIENDFTWAENGHPMVESYKDYLPMPHDRPTWDLTAVLYAVEGDKWFTMSEKCDVEVTEKGQTLFTPNENGNIRYMKVDEAQAEAINSHFQELMTARPAIYSLPKPNIIFETDMGNDVDDAMALDMIYKYLDKDKVNLLGITINKEGVAPAEFIDIMNTWYGYPEIPIGIIRNGADVEADDKNFVKVVAGLKNEDGTPKFARSLTDYESLPDAHILYRKILSEMPDSSVTIVSVGFSTNLARLLDTPADEYSPLTGKELVAKKVKLLSNMAGHIYDPTMAEFNMMKDPVAAKKVFEEWPSKIVTSPFEVGIMIQYPGSSIENDFLWAEGGHPMVEAYKAYIPMPYDRPTWDLTSLLYAVEGGHFFDVHGPCSVSVTEKGGISYVPDEDGNRFYLITDQAQADAINRHFQRIITGKPAIYKE